MTRNTWVAVRALGLAIACAGLLPALSCGAPPLPSTPARAAPSSSAPIPSAPGVGAADPGAQLSQRVGTAKPRRLPALRARAARSSSHDGHFYVAVPLELDTGDASAAEVVGNVVYARVAGARHALAVLGQGSAGPELLLRFVGKAPVTGDISLGFGSQPDPSSKRAVGGIVGEITVEGAAQARADARLASEYLASARDWFGRRSWQSPSGDAFFSFAAARLDLLSRARQGTAPGATDGWQPPRFFGREDELGQLMNLYTGMTSIEEALQVERGLASGPRTVEKRSLELSTVSALPLPSHPWPRMMSELPGSAKPVLEPLAASVPAEMAYLHFHDIRSLIGMLGELDGWITPLAQTLERAAGFRSFGTRYDAELGVRRTGLAEKLGHVAVDGVALATTDPYLREGSDVSLVFHVKSRTLLLPALDAMAQAAKNERPGTTAGSFTVHGKRVDTLISPDRTLRQHRLDLGEVLVLSNSKAAVSRFAEVAARKRKSLSESGDFRYLRARYPFDPKQEDGFLFVGDAFIANVTSPRSKILEARRMAAGADLSAVAHAALLFGWLEGRRPKDVAELLSSGLLTKAELKHPEGDVIRLDLESGPRSRFGSPARLESLVDLELGKVSAEERAAYDRFRDGYQQYWRAYVDPIGVRVRRSADGKRLSADVRILPLIERSDYDDVIRDVGEQTVTLPPLGAGLRWVLALGKDAEIRRLGDGAARRFTGRRDIALGWIGDWLAVGASDRSGLWDLALASGEIPEVGERRTFKDLESEIVARTPVYVAIHVKSRVGLAAVLAAARVYLDESASGILRWEAGESHRGVKVTRVTAKDRPDDPEIVVHYGVAEDVLIVSLDRYTLERQIDAVLDGKMPSSKDKGDVQTSLELRPDRADGFLAKTLAGLLHGEASAAHHGAALAYEALARGLVSLPDDPAAARRSALAWLGFEPASPHGGELRLEPDGSVTHPIVGSEVAPTIVEAIRSKSAIDGVVRDLELAQFSVAFEGKGDHRGLHAVTVWNRR